jgi:hypothetical protein
MVIKPHVTIVLVAVVIALAGCSPQTPVESPDPQPTESQAPDPGEPLAAGDCDQLLVSADVAQALGGSTEVDPYFTGSGLPQLAIVGGLRCHWAYGEQGSPGFTTAFLDVVPESVADAGEIDAAAADTCDDAGSGPSNRGCVIDTTTNGWWYHLAVFTFEAATPQGEAGAAVRALIEGALTEAAPPARIDALPEVDCAASGVDAPVTTSRLAIAADSGQGPVAVAADRLARPTGCAFTIDGGAWTVTTFPGSTAAWDHCPGRTTGETVEVPGVADAFAPPFDGLLMVCVGDGTSSAWLTAPDDGMVTTEWNEGMLATAGSLAAPVLAVASA